MCSSDLVRTLVKDVANALKTCGNLTRLVRTAAAGVTLANAKSLSEIEEQLSHFAKETVVLSFHPHLGPMSRGLCSTISVKPKGPLDKSVIFQCWEDAYSNKPFVQILKNGNLPETGQVVGTNRIDLAVEEDARVNRYILCSAEDNLLKGAGGQAVQSMNLCNGYEEDCGLL